MSLQFQISLKYSEQYHKIISLALICNVVNRKRHEYVYKSSANNKKSYIVHANIFVTVYYSKMVDDIYLKYFKKVHSLVFHCTHQLV